MKDSIEENEYKEQLRKKWLEEEQKNRQKHDIHYQDIRFDGKINTKCLSKKGY